MVRPLSAFATRHPRISSLAAFLLHFGGLVGLDLVLRLVHTGGYAPLGREIPLFFSIAWCALLASVTFVLPVVARRVVTLVTGGLFTVVAGVHLFFVGFFGTFMSFSSVIFTGDGVAFFDFSYFHMPRLSLALALLCGAAEVASALLVPRARRAKLAPVAGGVVAAAAVVCLALLTRSAFSDLGGITWESDRTPAEIYDDFTDHTTCMQMVGLYQYTFRDLLVFTGLSDVISQVESGPRLRELDAYYASKPIDEDNEMTGLFAGKNLLLIQLECIDTWMLNDTAMPNLSALAREGITFANYYAPKYLWGATFNSENLANTGVITPMSSSRLSNFDRVAYPWSAAHMFAQLGYTVNSFHRSGGNIYNRAAVHTNWGYEAYHSGEDMGLSDLDLDSCLTEAYDMMVSDGPFMSFIITYSGHGPYSPETKEAGRYYDELAATLPDAEEEYVLALCHARETDVFIGKLMDKLRADGHAEDTVLLLYTDHYDHYLSDPALLPKLKGTSDTNLLSHVPCILWSAGLAPMEVQKPVATYDLLPTVANLFSLPTDGRYYFGNDAFSPGGGYVIFPDRSWLDSEEYFNVNRSKPTEKSAARSDEIALRMDASFDSVKLDYWAKK